MLTLADYIDLVDWTGGTMHPLKRGTIPVDTPRALSCLALESLLWIAQVRSMRGGYWRAIGGVEAMIVKARAMGQRWLKGVSLAVVLFGRGVG